VNQRLILSLHTNPENNSGVLVCLAEHPYKSRSHLLWETGTVLSVLFSPRRLLSLIPEIGISG